MNDNQPNDDPLKFAVSVKTEAEFMRLPPAGEHDPIFALKRSFLNSLILPGPENNWRPPVKSIVLRRKRARKGVRLIEIVSLRAYIQEQVQIEAARQAREHPQIPVARAEANPAGPLTSQ
jgi:hypothetical protein